MDYDKIGKLILSLRKEKNMTQKKLADAMNLSDRTISKWERGVGCPDISLLNKLSEIFGVNIEKILSGDLYPNDKEAGNMRRVKFYVCPTCNNVLFSIGKAEVFCCGRKLLVLAAEAKSENHSMNIEEIENDYFITIDHEMTKSHYINMQVRTYRSSSVSRSHAGMKCSLYSSARLYPCVITLILSIILQMTSTTRPNLD